MSEAKLQLDEVLRKKMEVNGINEDVKWQKDVEDKIIDELQSKKANFSHQMKSFRIFLEVSKVKISQFKAILLLTSKNARIILYR